MFKAIIIGGTGATGKQLLNQLMQNQNCKLVIYKILDMIFICMYGNL